MHAQLRRVTRDLGLRAGDGEAHPDAVHRSLLAGLLSHVGQRQGDTREYRGARNARFTVWPGSSLADRPPSWIMAAELVETSRLWGRTVARVRPEWVEQVGAHLVQRRHDEPMWSAEQGQALVHETVSLFGLVLAADRLVPLRRLDPSLARTLFIRHALVDGDWDGDVAVLVENRALLDDLEALEDRFRRRDLVAGAGALARAYDRRLPDDVDSARAFERWRRRHRDGADPLALAPEDLLDDAPGADEQAAFPEFWHQGDLTLALSYVYDPADPYDGVTVHLPVAVLPQVRPDGFDWLVPGLRTELVATLVRALPKDVRRALPPAADVVDDVLAEVGRADGPLLDVLARRLGRLAGTPIDAAEWDRTRLAPHLRMTFRVEGPDGEGLAEGKDLAALQARLADDVRRAIAGATADLERDGLRTWDVGSLPRRVERTVGADTVVGYPALVDRGDAVAVRVLESEAAAHEATWAGNRRLVRLAVPIPARAVADRLVADDALALAANPEPSIGALVEQCLVVALDDVLGEHGAPVWDATGFDALVAAARAELAPRAVAIAGQVAEVLSLTRQLDARLADDVPAPLRPTVADVAGQRQALVHPGVVAAVGAERLDDLARYLRAALHRLDTAGRAPGRDHRRMAEVRELETAYDALVDAAGPALDPAAAVDLEHLGWLLEELRVQRFAEHLGTAEPVSVTRVGAALDAARRRRSAR